MDQFGPNRSRGTALARSGFDLPACQLSGRRVPVRMLPALNRPAGPRTELPVRWPRVEIRARERLLDPPPLVWIQTERFPLSLARQIVPPRFGRGHDGS